MFRTFTALWRRPAPPAPREAAGSLGTPPAPLPRRTPGLSLARRHVYAGIRSGFAAIRDVDAWHDTESTDEAHVREVAALHQLDAALAELAAARATLTAITRKGHR